MAVLASVGAGIHDDLSEAVERMVRVKKRVWFDPEKAEIYDRTYHKYLELHEMQWSMQCKEST